MLRFAIKFYKPAAIIFVVCAILTAGLWPFQFFTLNHALYDKSTGTLICDRFSSAYIPLSFSRSAHSKDVSLAAQFRLSFKPLSHYPYFARILTLFDKSSGSETIAIGQWEQNLIVRVQKIGNETGLPIVAELGVDSFFAGITHTEVSMVIQDTLVSVYAGNQLMEFRNPILPVTAIMVMGNSPWGDSPWMGTLGLGLEENFQAAGDSLTFIGGRAPALIIPRFYHPIKRIAFKPIWQDFAIAKWYALDVVLNFSGFIPYGLLLALLFYRKHQHSSMLIVWVSVGVGFSTSFVIESLQIFLPYRSSQMSDVVFNTLGTAFGAALFFVWKTLVEKTTYR